jgi:hypothetical protein
MSSTSCSFEGLSAEMSMLVVIVFLASFSMVMLLAVTWHHAACDAIYSLFRPDVAGL